MESEKDKGTTFFFTLPLEEVSGGKDEYYHAYKELIIGKYQQAIPTKLDTYLQKYLAYFGPEIKYFESVGELKELLDFDFCDSYWVDIDKAKQNMIDAIDHIDKEKLVVIANVTSRSKIEELGIPQEHTIFKPVTPSKLKLFFRTTTKTAPLNVFDKEEEQATRFDADILVVEDNIINQKLIKRVLEDFGLNVDLANNGLEAFEKRKSHNYDMIFMDIQMPVMDGVEATHEILDYEEDEGVAHVPIVALTANALKGDRERFLNEGLDEYITKPIETSELTYILNKFLKHKAVRSTKRERTVVHEEKIVPDKRSNEEPIEVPVHALVTEENETTIELDLPPLDEDISTQEVATTSVTRTHQEQESAADKKRILIARRQPLERKLLAKVLHAMGESYDLYNEEMGSISKLASMRNYDIILVDSGEEGMGDGVRYDASASSREELERLIRSVRG